MRNLKLVEGLPWELSAIEDITDLLPKGKEKWETREPEQISSIIIHHSSSPEGSVTTHARNHVRRWNRGIAYHISIDKGKIYQTNDLLSLTYHAKNANTYGIGIEVNRDLRKKDLTDDERKLLYAAILSVKAVIPSIKHIKGHGEVSPTSCPVTSMGRIRKDIADIELEMHLSQQDQPKQVAAFVAVERMNDLYKTVRADNQYSDTALSYLLAVEKFMRDNKILK